MSTKPLPVEAVELLVPGDATPMAEGHSRIVKHGIQLKCKGDQPLEPTFAVYSYSWAPFTDSTLFKGQEQWIELVETAKPGPHICCCRLHNDEQLMNDVAHCSGASTLAVIAINDKNSYSINPGAYQDKECAVPVLILTSEDGKRLQRVLQQHQGGILARVMLKRDNLRLSRRSRATNRRSDFNLKMELKSLLFPLVGVLRIASENVHMYQQAMDMFQQFEQEVHGSLLRGSEREEGAHKALKLLVKRLDDTLPSDFPFYIGILYRIHQNESVYRCDKFSEFISDCMKKMEQSDPVAVAAAMHGFLNRRDFESVRLYVGHRAVSPYVLLDRACESVLEITCSKYRASLMGGRRKHHSGIYPRMFWITITMKIRSETQPLTAECNLWRKYILKEMEQTHLDSSVVKQLKDGLEFGKLVDLPSQLTFAANLLLPLIAPDKGLNPFTEISHAIQTLERYIFNQHEFTELLTSIRNSHAAWFTSTSKKKEYLKKISREQTLPFAIRGGLAFLDMVHSIWQKRGWKLHQIHSECQQWLLLLTSLVDASAVHADAHFKEFLVSSFTVTKIHHDHIKHLIIACGNEKQHKLSLQSFYELYKAFNFWPKDFIEGFIKNFKLSQSVKLSDAIWQDLFTLVVERLPCTQYYELICAFLEEAETCYHKSKRDDEFLQDLLKLNVPGLFQPDSTSSLPVMNERLMVLIQGHIRRAGQNSLQHSLPDILDKCFSGEVGYFQQQVLEVVLKELISDSQVLKGQVDCMISKPLSTVIEMLCADLKSSFSNPTASQEFCWKFVIKCCLKIIIHEQNFDWISTYSHATTKLGQLHHVYCALSSLSDRECILHEIPQQVENQPLVIPYFLWVQRIHKFLLSWNNRLSADEGTYDQILLYSRHYLHIYELGKAVAASSVVIPSDTLGRMKAQFCSEFEELKMILIPYVAGLPKVCYRFLPALLEEYGLQLPATVEQQIHKMIIFSGEEWSERFPMTSQPKTAETPTLERHEITMQLTTSTSLKELTMLTSDLLQFLKPIKPYLIMLVGLCDNEIFRKYLQLQQEEQTLAVSRAAHGENEMNLLRFQLSLKQTVALLANLIEGSDITYKQITAEGKLNFEKLNIKREFADIGYFLPDRQSEKGLIGIQSMMELFQFAHHINRIHDVLKQYHLQNCLQDKDMKYLLAIELELKDQNSRESLKPVGAMKRLETVLKLLCLRDTSDTDFLRLFTEVGDCTEFYAFVQEQFFGMYGEHQQLEASTRTDTVSEEAALTTFQQLYEIITWQLQHEDYNEQVLNHLKVAFRYILPFINREQDFHTLMTKIVHLDACSEFKELQTVNDNINLIRLWFSRAEGDTLENVSKELECILESGCYHFTMSLATCAKISLEFEAFTAHRLTHRTSRLSGLPKVALSPKAHVTERWSNWQIVDFVRKLGLLDSHDKVEKQISYFLQLNGMVYKLGDVISKLMELGHSQQHQFADPLPCNTSLSEAEEKLSHAEDELSRWQDRVTKLRQSHKWLLFFRVPKVLSLSALLQAFPEPMVNRIVKEISFLFHNSLPVRQMLEMNIPKVIQEVAYTPNHSTAMSAVGVFLDELLMLPEVRKCTLPQRFVSLQLPAHSASILHIGMNYSQNQLLRLIIDILGGVPESFDILRCHPSTTEDDLKLFIKRAENFPRQYVIVEVNHLPYYLQEVLLKLYLDSRPMTSSTVHFIETAPSIIREVPWIQTRDHNDLGPSLSFQDAQKICLETAAAGKFETGKHSNVILVYGYPGVGKTHYVHSKLHSVKHSQIIAVNEAFTRLNAICKLNKLPTDDESCSIFFNFSLLPPGGAVHESERDSYKQLMNEIGWFFFDLLVLGYIQDVATGECFHLPFDLGWNIYVEVPSRGLTKEDPEATLRDFREKDVPSLGLVGCEHYVPIDAPYCVDGDVQLVCKYLRAYKSGKINTLYKEEMGTVTLSLKQNLTLKEFPKAVKSLKARKEFVDHLWDAYSTGNLRRVLIQGSPIRFGTDADAPHSLCHDLLNEFMSDEIKRSKMTQKLFISYMARRCKFLDSFPAFNLNSGLGEKIVVNGRAKGFTNTFLLGSTLMKAMLQEVNEICLQNQEGWAQKTHQQLLYDYKSGGGTIGLISLTSEQLPGRSSFERIGIAIPTGNEMHSRKFLDLCLSRVLDVPLNYAGRLAPIDENNYVLTLDYALKMLNIHERYKCGVPVIIEGETGVGKTALVEMLSKLWNHAWVAQWNRDKIDLLELMQQNLAGLPVNSTLERCLHVLEDLYSGQSIKEGKLELIVIQPDASYLTNQDKVSSASSVEERVVTSYSEELMLNTSLFFEPPSQPQGFWLVLRQRLLKVQGNPILSLLEFPPTKDNVTLDDSLFHTVREDENNVKAITKLLYLLLNARLRTTFHKLNVDAAMKPAAIREFFRKVFAQAAELQESFHNCSEKWPHLSGVPFVIVYLDEVNTSSCLGLFKEIIVDRTIDGEELPKNVFILAACNPHRGNSLASRDTPRQQSKPDVISMQRELKTTYYVRQLHPTLELLKWDYGALNEYQEQEYVTAKMILLQEQLARWGIPQLSLTDIACLTELIVDSQKKMREYAHQQLVKGGKPPADAVTESKSTVSQRDIQRVFTFYKWLMHMYSKFDPHQYQPEYHRRAVLVALGLVYYMRLTSHYRKRYGIWLDHPHKNLTGEITFSRAIEEELNWYAERVELPPGIAKTQALKENLLATIVCCVTRTPLIIEGAPGSSKTLSFNITVANLKGKESKRPTFQETSIFHGLDPHFYQCSRRTTSEEIKTIFQRAINRQQSQSRCPTQSYCVVFMDEAGLPETERESLKALHYYLDDPEVSFVAITNHALDAAKTNRAISLYRPASSVDDLKTLAKECLQSVGNHNIEVVERFCSAYSSVMAEERWQSFFGLRDFIYFLIYLRRKHNSAKISSQTVLEALERNFNGTEDFQELCQEFLVTGTAHLHIRNILEILKDSLKENALSSANEIQMGIQSEVRYKLLIDPSEDDSLLRFLFEFGVLDPANTKLYVCSDFPGDSHSEINTIANIRHSAFKGDTVLLCQTDRIHESFYDLFNQRFRCIHDRIHGPRYYANIAIGAHSKPSRVEPTFQCVVVLKRSEIKDTPSPFLNRFEKYFLSYKAMLHVALGYLPPCLRIVVETGYAKAKEFIKAVEASKSLYGFSAETLDSLLLTLLPSSKRRYSPLKSDDIISSVKSPSSDMRVFLLQSLLYGLREISGFQFFEPPDEVDLDASSLFTIIDMDKEFRDIIAEIDQEEAAASVDEALQVLHCAPAPDESQRRIEALTDSCVVISLLQQWIVRYLCKRLMQLMTPEALAIHHCKIPTNYCENYLMHQVHFSLKQLLSRHLKWLGDARECYPTKLLCFTRSSSLITQKLPVQYPSKVYASGTDSSCYDVNLKELVCDDPEQLLLCKVTTRFSQGSFEKLLKQFTNDDSLRVFLTLVNMQDVTRNNKKVVNHLRIMIENAESQSKCRGKLFVVLLHFPPVMFFDACYPSLFVRGWDHHYLDTIMHSHFKGTSPIKTPIDIKHWFRRLCLADSDDVDDEAVVVALHTLLEEAIPVISSRVCFGSQKMSPFNCPMDGLERSRSIKTLLMEKGVGQVLCTQFHLYWKPKVMIEYIRKAAGFTYNHESTLNLTDSVLTIFKSLFFDFMVYMTSRINENFNIDMLYSPDSPEMVHKLFLDILKVLRVPHLSELKTRSGSLTAPSSMSPRTYYSSRFPFFKDIFQALEDLIDKCREHVNQLTEDDTVVRLPHSRRTKHHKERLLSEVGKAQFTTILKEAQVKYINVVCSAISRDECDTGQVGELWQRYLRDFMQLKFHLVSMSDESTMEDLGVQILKDYFSPLNQAHDVLTRLVALHAHVHVHQLSLARATSILRTLNRLEIAFSPSLMQRTDRFSFAESLQISGYIFQHRQDDLAIFIINRFFTTLQALLQDPVDSIGLQCWYKSCQDMLSMSVLKENLYGEIPQEQSTKLTILYATILVMQSTLDWDDCCSRAHKLFLTLSTIYLPSLEQLEGGVCVPQLVEVVLLGAHVLLNHPHGNTALKQFLEGLLRHFFSEYQAHYQPVDCKWFVELANNQFTIPSTALECLQAHAVEFSQPDILAGCLSWGMCKFFLSRILGNDEQTSGYSDAPIILHRPEARARIGQVLTANCLETPGPYIPLCYQYVPHLLLPEVTLNMVMMQRLAHLYYELVMEHLLGHDLSLIALQKIAANLEKWLADTDTVPLRDEKALLFIEKQAVFQVIIQKVAENPDDNLQRVLHSLVSLIPRFILQLKQLSSAGVITTRMMGKVNEMFEEDLLGGAHALVLALQLLRSREINSYNKLLQLLTDEYSNVNREITCLKHLQPLLPAKTISETHLFPFIGQNVDNSELGILYQQVCDAVMAVYYNKDSAQKADRFIAFAEKWCLSSSQLQCGGMDGNLAFKMTLWLCVYYQLYDRQQTSKTLARLIGRMTHILEEEYIQLLRCFLDPKKMFHKEAAPLPINPQTQLFKVTGENQVVPVQHRGHKYDPIYDLFNPRNIAKQDYSLVSLRHSLANMVAAIVGCPQRSNHLWYHMFAANELRDSYITGFMYNDKISPGRLYDCGVELTPDGDYGRSDYLQQSREGSLSLHSRYVLLWANFAAFCMALLTQPSAQEKISGNVISSWQPIRHYCLSQLHTVWMHMGNNLKLSFEEQSFFVMRCMERLIEHGVKNPESLQGRIESSQARDDYEQFWERHIFAPSRAELSEKFDEYYQQLSREQPLLKHLKLLEAHYQYFPSEKDLRHYIEQRPLIVDPNNELHLLLQFVQEQNHLKAGAVLLPDLIEFYQWLHTDVAYTLSRKKATKVTIKDKVMEVACRYGDEKAGDHLLRLYDRVRDGYNTYVKAIGGAIGVGACANVKQENKLYTIEDDYPLLYFLSDTNEEEGGNDWLFLVIADIISAHNAFLTKVSCSKVMDRYYFTEVTDISPTEVNEHTCIMGIPREQHGISDYLQLVRSRYQPPSLMEGKGPSFDLPALQKDILVAHLAGRSIIMNPSTIRTVFKFKEKHRPLHNPTDLALDLQAFTQLPLEYKIPLESFVSIQSGEPYLKHLEFEFHSADYNKMLEVVTGLCNAAEHLLKVLEEPKQGSQSPHEGTQDLTVPQFLCSFVYNELPAENTDEVFSEIGINSLSHSQLTCLAELKMKFLFSVLQQFKSWIEDGLYDFYTLPIGMKKHLRPEDTHTMQSIPSSTYYKGTLQGLQQLEMDLKSLTEALRHSQSYVQTTIKELSQKPAVPYLQEIHLITENNHLCKLIPETVLMENYVDIRIALRRLLAKVRGDMASSRGKPSSEEKWIEVVVDLWDTHLKHVRERATRYQRPSDFLFDPTTMKFGFQQGFGTGDSDSEAESESESDEEPLWRRKKHTVPITQGIVATVKRFTVADVSQYLYYLKLDDHVKAFEESEIDGQLLLEVMENDAAMKELGVKSILQQIRIKSKLQEYILK